MSLTDGEKRELCDWLAEHLMKWVTYSPADSECMWLTKQDDADPIPSGFVPSAWLLTGDGMLAVLEAMRDRGFAMEAEWFPHDAASVWFVDKPSSPEGIADSLPLAVVLAAKAALEANSD